MRSGRTGRAGGTAEWSRDRSAPRIDALVLAAGRSTRFGEQKLVAAVGGMPLVRRTVTGVLGTGVREVRVVTGADEEDVRAALLGLRVAFTSNRVHAAGMGTSISAGVRALAADCDAVVVTLGDQPTSGAVIDGLIDAYIEGGSPIVVPEFRGVRGPPVLFGRECFDALMSLEGDTGARGYVAENPALVRVLAMEGDAPPDIDTRSDAEAFETGDSH